MIYLKLGQNTSFYNIYRWCLKVPKQAKIGRKVALSTHNQYFKTAQAKVQS